MNKNKILCITTSILIFLNLGQVYAKENQEFGNINYIDIFFDGQVFIDKQTNGICEDFIKDDIEILNLSIEINDENKLKTYKNFAINNNDKEEKIEYYVNCESFSENANMQINGKVKLINNNLEFGFEKIYTSEELKNFMENTNGNLGYNIEINSHDLRNFITCDIIFKSENGGSFENDETYIEHISNLPGEKFVDIPHLIANKGYEFDGWYDENTEVEIDQFPEYISKDMCIIAKWKKINNYVCLKNNEEKISFSNWPKAIWDNNIMNYIISFVIMENYII